MNIRRFTVFVLPVLTPAFCAFAADITVFFDVAAFQAQTGAAAQPELPPLGLVGRHVAQTTVGDLTFSINNQSPEIALVLDEFTPLHPGSEIALSDWEALDVTSAFPVHALGSFFVEGTSEPFFCSALCPCVNATYLVSIKLAGLEIASFTFNAPDDVLYFVGVWSDEPFDRVEYRDLSQQCDNEVWGRFFLGLTPPGCAADFNGDGFLDFFDYTAFVDCFEAVECPPGKDADFNRDGFVDFFDADAFLEAFEAGC